MTLLSPSGTLAGTMMLIWYSPGPTSPAKTTGAAKFSAEPTPPIRTPGVAGNGPDCDEDPLTRPSLGRPNPVAHRVIVSPGRAGENGYPGTDIDVGPTRE